MSTVTGSEIRAGRLPAEVPQRFIHWETHGNTMEDDGR